MSSLSREQLAERIERLIARELDEDLYEVERVSALSLLSWNRLDICFKLIFLELADVCPEFALEIYEADIRAQTFGTYKERGNAEKLGIERYIKDFESTRTSIQENGFLDDQSIIPLSRERTILNGAHRVAVSIENGTDVSVVNTGLDAMDCDYLCFQKRGMPRDLIEAGVCKFIELRDDAYIAFLWPSSAQNWPITRNLFGQVIYESTVDVTSVGARNIIREVYRGAAWLGQKRVSSHKLKQKQSECFPVVSPVLVIAFQSESLQAVRDIKQSIRDINGIGFSSVHVTDNQEEALRLSKLLFNQNGRHFLNHANPERYSWRIRVNAFRQQIASQNIPMDQCVIDGSVVLEAYGLRPAGDVDFLMDPSIVADKEDVRLVDHAAELEFHAVDIQHLIHDPRYQFVYEGVKFISFRQLYQMKTNRASTKDQKDCSIMETLLQPGKEDSWFAKASYRVFFFWMQCTSRVRFAVIDLTQHLGIYTQARTAYRWLKRL